MSTVSGCQRVVSRHCMVRTFYLILSKTNCIFSVFIQRKENALSTLFFSFFLSLSLSHQKTLLPRDRKREKKKIQRVFPQKSFSPILSCDLYPPSFFLLSFSQSFRFFALPSPSDRRPFPLSRSNPVVVSSCCCFEATFDVAPPPSPSTILFFFAEVESALSVVVGSSTSIFESLCLVVSAE